MKYKKIVAPIVGMLLMFVIVPASVSAATLTVTSSGDATANDGVCTLREAIYAANIDNASMAPGECAAGSGADTINFNIPGSGIHTISPTTPLPNIDESLNIDGTTQPGATCEPRSLRIEIDSTDAYTAGSGIVSLNFLSNDNVLQGVSMYGEPDDVPQSGSDDVVATFRGSGSSIRCNNFGMTADNKQASVQHGYTNNIGGVSFSGSADDTRVGGLTPADRNVFGDTYGGITNFCDDIGDNLENLEIFGNYFGTDTTGQIAFPGRQTDISLACGENTRIGNASSDGRNIFAGSNSTASVTLVPVNTGGSPITGTKIQGNHFGLNSSGNAASGFSVSPAAIAALNFPAAALGGADSDNLQNLIGGTTASEANVITGFPMGVVIGTAFLDFGGGPLRSSLPVQDISVIGNKIYGNDFGIELCDINVGTGSSNCADYGGPNPNDPGDTDTGANDYINKPEITAISQIGDQITFTYDLDVIGSPSDQYRVEFFSNDTADNEGYGQGQNMLGAVTAIASGPTTGLKASFTLPSDNNITTKVFSATTTVIDSSLAYGFGSTSEFGRVIDNAPIGYTAAAVLGGNSSQNTTSQLAETGDSQSAVILFALMMALSSVPMVISFSRNNIYTHKK